MFFFKHKKKLIDKNLRQALLEFSIKECFNLKYENLIFSKNDYGKPQITNIENVFFNISHCEGLIICAVSNSDIGVDVENIRDFDKYAARKVCNEEELNQIYLSANPNKTFFSYWTLKESLGKALGVGLNYPMKKNKFIFRNEKIFSSYDGLILKQINLLDNYLISICTDENQKEIELKEVKFNGRKFYRF